jgi:hypothetical protein
MVTSWTTLSPSAISSSTSNRRPPKVLWRRRAVCLTLSGPVGCSGRAARLVVHEIGMDELVRELEIPLRIDLLESATDQPLVVLGHRHRHRPIFTT